MTTIDVTSTDARLLWEAGQRPLVTDILVDYCDHVDANDPDTLVETVFTDDAAYELGSRHTIRGRDDLRRMFTKTFALFDATSHHVTNIRIRFDGEAAAHASSSVYAWHIMSADGSRAEVWGRYDDDLRLTPEGWRISRRRLTAFSENFGDDPFERPFRNA